MRRRDVLRSSAGALALAGLGGATSAAQDDASYTPLGEVDVEGATEVVTTKNDDYAVVAAGTGFAVVDVTDPAAPEIAAERGNLLSEKSNGPMKSIADVKVDGDRLLVTGPNGPVEAPKAALLYDIADPANPEQLDVLEVEHPIHNSFFADGYAYLTVSDFKFEGPKIVDTSGDSMEVVSKFSIVQTDDAWTDVQPFLRSCHDLYVQGDYMYLAQWDAGTFIVDVSDKTSPELLQRVGGLDREELAGLESRDALIEVGLEPPGNAHYVAVDTDASHMYVGAESWDMTPDDDRRGAGGIDVWDISEKTSPEKLTTIKPPGSENEGRRGQFTTSHNFDLSNGRLYTSWYYGGVMIHDVSDPANPERLSWWRDPEEAQFWGAETAVDGEFFVASNMGPGDTKGSLLTFADEAGEMPDPPGVFTPPEETSLVTSVDWSKYDDDASEKTTTTDERTTESATTEESSTTEESTTETDDGTGVDDGSEVDDGTEMNEGTELNEDTEMDEETTAESEGMPGFGALAAAGGLGLGAARFLAGDDDADEE